MPQFPELFAHHVATGLAHQLALAEFLGDRDWQLDVGAGTATFGRDLRFDVQILGTESHRDGTWLWSWANTASGIPEPLLHLSGWLRQYGHSENIAELVEPGFPLERADGHRLALLASSLTGRCYYRGPYDGGAVFFHLENTPPALTAPVTPQRATTVLSQVISGFPVDHRTAADAFLRRQGWTVDNMARAIQARNADGAVLRLDFDDHHRIATMSL